MRIVENPDKEFVTEMRKALEETKGYCHCTIEQSEDTKCICKAFREQAEPGQCFCGLYTKEKDDAEEFQEMGRA